MSNSGSSTGRRGQCFLEHPARTPHTAPTPLSYCPRISSPLSFCPFSLSLPCLSFFPSSLPHLSLKCAVKRVANPNPCLPLLAHLSTSAISTLRFVNSRLVAIFVGIFVTPKPLTKPKLRINKPMRTFTAFGCAFGRYILYMLVSMWLYIVDGVIYSHK